MISECWYPYEIGLKVLDICIICAVTHAVSNFTILQMKTAIIYIVADGENLSEHTANFLYQRWTDFLSSVHLW